jgi:hypothetical protein
MNTEDKVKRYVVNPDKTASSKARRFYRVLSGKVAPRRCTNRELQRLINEFGVDRIQQARANLRASKRATKYQRAFCGALAHGNPDSLSRAGAEEFLRAAKANRPEDFAEAKERLRGFTYQEEEV